MSNEDFNPTELKAAIDAARADSIGSVQESKKTTASHVAAYNAVLLNWKKNDQRRLKFLKRFRSFGRATQMNLSDEVIIQMLENSPAASVAWNHMNRYFDKIEEIVRDWCITADQSKGVSITVDASVTARKELLAQLNDAVDAEDKEAQKVALSALAALED